MHVVQQVHVEAEFAAQPVEERRHEVQIPLRAPDAFERHPFLRRLILQRAAAHAVRIHDAWNRALCADRPVPHRDVFLHRLHRLVGRRSVGVPVDHDRFT